MLLFGASCAKEKTARISASFKFENAEALYVGENITVLNTSTIENARMAVCKWECSNGQVAYNLDFATFNVAERGDYKITLTVYSEFGEAIDSYSESFYAQLKPIDVGGRSVIPQTEVNWYVSVNGDGTKSGADKENPMSLEDFRTKVFSGVDNSAINNSTFHFAAGEYVLPCAEYPTPTLDGNGSNLTVYFQGETDAVLSAGGAEVLLSVGANVKTILENFSIINLKGKDVQTAPISLNDASSSLTLSLCNLSDNDAVTGNGCVYASAGELAILNTVFMTNNAAGAIIALEGEDLVAKIDSCAFQGNISADAAAPAVVKASRGQIKVHASSFVSNSGSALLLTDGVKANVCANKFELNINENLGGAAIRATNASLDQMVENEFLSNVGLQGGAVYVSGTPIDIKTCKFQANSSNVGAALYVADDASELTALDCEFMKNSGADGASIYLKAPGQIKSCYFHDNKGTSGTGTAVYVDCGDTEQVRIESCRMVNNNMSGADGGAITVNSGYVTVENCEFTGNKNSNKRSGAFRVQGSAYALLKNCNVSASTGTYGGALTAAENSTLKIVGGTFENNTGTAGGCLMANGASKLIIEGALIRNNTATNGHGGAILREGSGDIEITGTTFESNYISSTGTAVRGGAFGNNGTGTFRFKDCIFRSNHCETNGGGALNFDGVCIATFDNCLFDGNYNSATGIPGGNGNGNYAGGAIRIGSASDLTFNDCRFEGNYLPSMTDANHLYGGAIHVNTGATLKMNRCSFVGNHAVRGGAISSWATGAKVYLNDCAFDGNWISYNYGTTIYVEKASEFAMNNCTIADNTYTTDASGAYESAWISFGNVTDRICVSNCSFIGSPRIGESAAPSSLASTIIRFDEQSHDNNWFINDIIVTEDASGVNKSFANYSRKLNLAGTKYSSAEAVISGGSVNSTLTTGKGFAANAQSFGELAYMAVEPVYKSHWAWNGTLAGGDNLQFANLSDVKQAVNTACPGFRSWLDSIKALDEDQRGSTRGAQSWPGAYDASGKPKDPEKLPAPVPAATTIEMESALITWTAVENAVGYELKMAGRTNWTVTEPSALIESLTLDTQYSIQVKAIAPAASEDWLDSDWSAPLEFRTKGKTVLAKPDLRAENILSNEFTVNWGAVDNAAHYLYRVNSGEQKQIALTSLHLDGLTPETEYTVEVCAVPVDAAHFQQSEWASVKVTTKAPKGDDDKPGNVDDFEDKPIF